MTRRGNAAYRCLRCRLHGSLCICALIPRLETRTRLVLFIHRREDQKSTNTGRLSTECLTNSEVFVRGHAGEPTPAFRCPSDSQPLLLFPREDATPITEVPRTGWPVTLIVPDGTWRQAAKVQNRVPGLRDVPCVSLPRDAPSAYRLRGESHAEGLATMEAIARAMGVLEGPHVRRALEHVFHAMVERVLWSRGTLDSAELMAGIPEGVMRHDPRSGLLSAR